MKQVFEWRGRGKGGKEEDLLARSLHRSSNGVAMVGGIRNKIRDAATQLDLAGLNAGMLSQGRLVEQPRLFHGLSLRLAIR